jgi:hypothetical protein
MPSKERLQPVSMGAPASSAVIDHAGQQPHRNIVHRLCGAGHETWGFGLAAGLARVVDVQRVLLLGSRDGV